MPNAHFIIDWCAGPSAQMEVFCPQSPEEQIYQLKYTSPFRSTIRPPVEKCRVGPGALDPVSRQLDGIVADIDSRAPTVLPLLRPQPAGPIEEIGQDVVESIEEIGQELYDLIVPDYALGDLAGEELFLEIGMNETLLKYPWELMHDRGNFLCLKHAIGRFVNGSGVLPPLQRPRSFLRTPLDSLSILLVSVPNPQPRDGEVYDDLPCAAAEARAIASLLRGVEGVRLETLTGRDAIYKRVHNKMRAGSYQIIHFNGHAKFDESNPLTSALVLEDRDMFTGAITQFLSKSPPVLCFVNACETAKIVVEWQNRYNIFGLARGFLETGAYLLGSRWKINDTAAAVFAEQFYRSLLLDGVPLGRAIREARKTCKGASPSNEPAWAAYTFYGDPRLSFLRQRTIRPRFGRQRSRH